MGVYPVDYKDEMLALTQLPGILLYILVIILQCRTHYTAKYIKENHYQSQAYENWCV